MKASSFSWISRTFSGGIKKITIQIPTTKLRTCPERKNKIPQQKTNPNLQTRAKMNAVISITLCI